MPETTDTARPAGHSLEAMRRRHGEAYRWRLLATVMIGAVAAIMSATIVNVAVPDMSGHFALTPSRAQWVSTAFMSAMTLAMLPVPWLLARFGYRRTYIGAVLLLMAGGIGGGLAQHYPLVLAMRVAEGLAAGVMQPIPAILVMRAFSREEQGRAMGVFGFGVVLAPAVGPSVGGVLVELFGWRSIFFVVVPFCIAALAMAQRYLPHAAPGGAAPGGRALRLDLAGLALAAAAVLALLNGLVGLHGGAPVQALLLLALAAVAGTAFVRHERRTPQPLLDLRVFAPRTFVMGSLVAFIYGMGLFGSTYLVPVFMQQGLGFAPSAAGAVLLLPGLVLAGTIVVAGRLADRGPLHLLVSAGLALLALSFALMAGVGPATGLPLLMLWATVGRIGLGCVLPSLNVGALRALEPALLSQGSSTINLLRQLGGAIGISLVGIVLEWRLAAHADDRVLAAFGETFWLLALVTASAILAAWRMRPAATRGD
ncbi:MFS transporter [Caldimonas tepidiphila]|uniref:MFS transporter n=1 Tax=Caldimonas tepidiphila TaxID=2315841 RepID=UPI001300BAA9|nr:MFS transporter [Caldimonas tepidiphila]